MAMYTLQRLQEPTLVIEEHGNNKNPAILFLHGFSQSRQVWKKQVNSQLAEKFYLVTVDLRGHGDSEKPYDKYHEAKAWADDVRAVLNLLDLKSVLIYAWSYAGIIVCDYLRYYGEEKIKGINFIAPLINNGREEDETVVDTELIPIFNDLIANDFNTSVIATRKFVKYLTYSEQNEQDFNYLLGINMLCPTYVRESLLLRQAVNCDLLANVKIPILLTHGNKDKIILLNSSIKQKELMPCIDISLYDNVGHMPFWEAPERFNDELIRFAEQCFKY